MKRSEIRVPVRGDVVAQARQVFRNVGAVLEAAGAGFSDVVKVTDRTWFGSDSNRGACDHVRRPSARTRFASSSLRHGPSLTRFGGHGLMFRIWSARGTVRSTPVPNSEYAVSTVIVLPMSVV